MFVINGRDSACPSYYTYNPRFYHIEGGLLFRDPPKISNKLKYFGLYKFACHIGTDPVLTSFAFHRSRKVDWGQTAARDGFVFYDFPPGKVYGLIEDAIEAMKRVKDVQVFG